MAGAAPKFKRLLLKLSGEALMGAGSHGIDIATATRFAREIAAARALGTEICLVVGGGNIFRGMAGVANGLPRGTADYMGMLATVMNSLALRGVLEAQGVPARAMSAIPMPTVCESFSADKARHHLAKGRVVIFGGGTGNPFFTTDTAAALRGSEIGADIVLKATKVDGIYTADPKKDPGATRYDQISFNEAIAQNLAVMDATAFALCRDQKLPINVFSIFKPGALKRVVCGENEGTLVYC